MNSCTIGDVAELVRGVTYAKSDATSADSAGALPLLRATNVTEQGLNTDDLVYIPRTLVRHEQMVQQGDILVTMSSGSASVVGRSVELEKAMDATFGAFCGILRAGAAIDRRYLSYMVAVPQIRRLWSDRAQGTNINNLKREDVLGTSIPLPPLDEQKRIVAKLDDVHSCLTSSEERLGREASLVGNARRSSVDRLFAQLDAGMEALEGICDVFADGDWVESKDQSPSGIRLVQTGNIGDGVFKDRREKARWISKETFVRLNCTEVFPGDILISRLPDPVGRACLIPETGDRMITAVDCTIVRPKLAILDPEFLVLYTSSSAYEAQVRGKITGTTRDRISRNNLGNLRIPVPTVAQQREIVAKAEEIESVLLGLEQTISIRRERFGNLRQSVLEAAFRGEF